MQNDNPITRLLYAILSQKCLKDINWDKVAHHPLLEPEDDKDKKINGHAARMRYSRFKKQMDAASGDLPPPTPRKPRKSRVEKTKSPKKEKRGPSEIKREYENERERNEGRNINVKSEFVDGREGTGESLDERETPDGSIMGASAVELAQRDLASGLAVDFGASHPGQNVRHPNTLHFPDLGPIEIKRERKPSANTLSATGLYAHSQLQTHSHSHDNSPLHRTFQTDFHTASHVTSSVSNSTLPNTPQMCIEEQEYSPTHSQSSHYRHPAHHSQIRTHPADGSQNIYDPHTESFTEDLEMDMDMDQMMHSFGHDGHELFSPLLDDTAFAFGMESPSLGVGMGMGGDSYEEFWAQGQSHDDVEGGTEELIVSGRDRMAGGVHVKKEARWEEGYRRA